MTAPTHILLIRGEDSLWCAQFGDGEATLLTLTIDEAIELMAAMLTQEDEPADLPATALAAEPVAEPAAEPPPPPPAQPVASAAAPSVPRFCRHCGAELPSTGAAFCVNCGAKLR